MAEDVCVTDRVRIETPEPLSVVEGEPASLSLEAIALRIYTAMMVSPRNLFSNRIGYSQVAWDAFEAAKAFRDIAEQQRGE
jgi:hypothetical protein